jgi:hypothetical protein
VEFTLKCCRRLVTIVILVCSNLAYADKKPGSEQQHQANAGVFEVAPGAQIYQLTSKYPSGSLNPRTDTTLFSSGVVVEYGMNSLFSAGFDFRYGWQWSDNAGVIVRDHHKVGWHDPSAFLKFKLDDLGPGSLRFQLSASKSLKEMNDSGNYSGGTKLKPEIGYEVYFGPNTLGVRFGYGAYIGAREYSPADEFKYKIKGGNDFTTTAFYEFSAAPYTLGFSLKIENVESSKMTADSMAAYDVNIVSGVGATIDYSSSTSAYELATYVPVDLSPTLRIVPAFSYMAAGAYDSSGLSSLDAWSLETTARWAF